MDVFTCPCWHKSYFMLDKGPLDSVFKYKCDQLTLQYGGGLLQPEEEKDMIKNI